jgi:hypothetical protein
MRCAKPSFALHNLAPQRDFPKNASRASLSANSEEVFVEAVKPAAVDATFAPETRRRVRHLPTNPLEHRAAGEETRRRQRFSAGPDELLEDAPQTIFAAIRDDAPHPPRFDRSGVIWGRAVFLPGPLVNHFVGAGILVAGAGAGVRVRRRSFLFLARGTGSMSGSTR